MKLDTKYRVGRIVLLTVAVGALILGVSMRSDQITDRGKPQILSEKVVIESEQQPDLISSNNDLSSALWKTVIVTFTILVLILLSAKGVKKFWGDRLGQESSSEINLISRRYLNPKQSLVLVEIRDRELLIGVTDHSINLVCDLSDADGSDNSDDFSELTELQD